MIGSDKNSSLVKFIFLKKNKKAKKKVLFIEKIFIFKKGGLKK
jgi:hypothetical protein